MAPIYSGISRYGSTPYFFKTSCNCSRDEDGEVVGDAGVEGLGEGAGTTDTGFCHACVGRGDIGRGG